MHVCMYVGMYVLHTIQYSTVLTRSSAAQKKGVVSKPLMMKAVYRGSHRMRFVVIGTNGRAVIWGTKKAIWTYGYAYIQMLNNIIIIIIYIYTYIHAFLFRCSS